MDALKKITIIAVITCLATVALLRVDRQCAMMYGVDGGVSEAVTELVTVFRDEIAERLN